MTLGEIFRVALLDTVLGMGTVFVVLIFISLIISCFGPLSRSIENFVNRKNKPELLDEIPAAAKPPVAPVEVEEDEELVDDLELVAVITAAIAAYSDEKTDGFVVRSIKRAKTSKRR
ncbi:hypothetical protein P261_01893 [Lachnospiraceae bacterium TWA4]|nr:hypothetical protein P261_01893 [Lachnospiraceae bacterium TWA4]